MSIRKLIPKEDVNEIAYIVEKYLPKIQYHVKMLGTKTVEDWESRISEQSLKDTEADDRPVTHDAVNLVDFSSLGITQKMTHIIQRLYPNQTVFSSGFFLYPPTGFMEWHTNSNEPGKRLYITYADEDKKSFFRYRDIQTSKIITDYDDKGLTFREFPVYNNPPYLWHAVGSNCNRYSFGYTIR